MSLDPYALRRQYPAFQRSIDGRPAVYMDGPGGTQMPESVIEAMDGTLRRGISNLGGGFASSRDAARITATARSAGADLFGADDDQSIIFGQNMTSLTFAMSRALAREWRPGDRIVTTSLDHDANITPWRLAATERGATVDVWEFDVDTTRLELSDLEALLTDRTKLVSVTHASNAFGTMSNIPAVVAAAHAVGAMVYVDAVHYAPHGLIDVAASGADFLVASAYKFFGPHTGMLYGKRSHLERLSAYKVRPAPGEGAGKWETGTQSFESLAAVTAVVDYIASIGSGETRRERIVAALASISRHEEWAGARFLAGLATMSHIRLYGLPTMEGRAPTFAIDVAGRHPGEVAEELGRRGVFVWSGDYYALEAMERLGLNDHGGLVRIGFVHTTTAEEVDRVLEDLSSLR